jgi:oligopeptide/dipeptide ABC transporter ATP-binding protein
MTGGESLALAHEDRPSDAILSLRDLATSFFTYRGVVEAVRGVSFDLRKGEMLGIVGESGAGKTVLAHSIIKQVRYPGRIVAGGVFLDDIDLRARSEKEMQKIRGRRIAFIASNAKAALDPLATVGEQLARVIRLREHLPKDELRLRGIDALRAVRIPDPTRRYDTYPHELSVGMGQRVLIAIALLHEPEVIIADEPTSGLDVTVQRQILNLIKALLEELGSATIVIAHDLGVVAQYCDRVGVMKDGRLLEQAGVREFFRTPRNEYSRLLLMRTRASIGGGTMERPPSSQLEIRVRAAGAEAGARPDELADAVRPLLSVENLVKHFPLRRGSKLTLKAVNDVSFELRPGEALGLVGESGSGKTTIGRLIQRLIEPTEGKIWFDGTEISCLSERDFRPMRPRIQMVFQEPHASLNPYMSVARNIEEPLIVQDELNANERRERVRELLHMVQLEEWFLHMYPHSLSAGQAQRVGIARAIATNPSMIVLDEPTSRLDMSHRGEMLELLARLKTDLGVAYIFISHDLTAVRSICSRLAIMYLGRIVELGNTDDVFEIQRHPYSKALLASVLHPDPEVQLEQFTLEGEIPSSVHLPHGCVLYSRCPIARPDCEIQHPPLEEKVPGWKVACYYSEDLAREAVARGRTRSE